MRGDELLDKMELIDAEYVEAADTKVTRKRNGWLKWAAVAACLVGAVAIAVHVSGTRGGSEFELKLSDQTTAKVTLGIDEGISVATPMYDLVGFTEEEMFAMEDIYIFRGTVVDLTNITIEFDAEWPEYNCIATIDVSRVYKGDIRAGEQIRMLLPCPVGLDGYWQEDTESIGGFKLGAEGIFMPMVYDEDSYWEEFGKVVMLQDLAPCGLGDGTRWVFFDNADQLAFERNFYPSLTGTTLDDVETYVLRMLGE